MPLNATTLSVLFLAAAIHPTVATDRRVASIGARHHRLLGSVLLPSIPGEVRAQVCGHLSTQMR